MNQPRPARPYFVALAVIALVVAVSFFAFHPELPFHHGYRVQAMFKSSNGLRTGSPVRIAGVNVGKVVDMRREGDTAVVTMELEDAGRPIHTDATARIRPRVFLEGGFQVALEVGSPSAPEMPNDGTIPVSRTALPVQFQQTLSIFEAPGRESLRTVFHELSRALSSGGARGFAALAPQLEPLTRDLAWLGEAFRGTEPHDLSNIIGASARINSALDAQPGRIGELVGHLSQTAGAFSDRDSELAATLDRGARILHDTPPAIRAVDSALPAAERAGRTVLPALPAAPQAFTQTTSVLRELGALVAPSRRARTLGALRTTLVDLPRLVKTLAEVFPKTKSLGDCLSSHVVPALSAVAPDGGLSSGRPIWQDFAHSLVGLSSAAQNFDGNGHAIRYEAGFGDNTLLDIVPGVGPLLSNAPKSLRSRPVRPANGQAPPYRTDVPCSSQPKVALATASRASTTRTRAAGPPPPRLTLTQARRLLTPQRLRALAGGRR